MSPTGIGALRAFALTLLIFCTSAGGKVCGQVGQVSILDNIYFAENTVFNLHHEVDTTGFQQLIRRYEDENIPGNTTIAGFIFVPCVIVNPTPPESQSQIIPDDALIPTNGQDYDPFEQEQLNLALGYTAGYRVFLAYWKNSAEEPGERTMGYLGYESMDEIMSLEPAGEGVFHFSILSGSETTIFFPDDEALLSDIPEFALAYMPIDDYEYIAYGTSYYPSNQDMDGLPRKIIVERSLAGQAFNLIDGTPDNLKKYRTLSFRPSPEPEWGLNREAGIAFKLAYFCPPFWDEDDLRPDTIPDGDFDSLIIQVPEGLVRDPGGPTGPGNEDGIGGNAQRQFQPAQMQQDSTTTQNSVLITPDSLYQKAFDNLANQHLEQARFTIQTNPDLVKWPEVWYYLKSNFWILIAIGLALLIAFLIGRSTSKGPVN